MNPYPPMLAKARDEAFDDPHYFFEVKWDGWRCVAALSPQSTQLFGRRKELTALFPELSGLHATVRRPCVLDGEIVALGPDGRPQFHALRKKDRTCVYMAFDLLESKGEPQIKRPLQARRAALGEHLLPGRQLQLSEGVKGAGRRLFSSVVALELEGMMAKELESPYLPGERAGTWLKIINGREEVALAPELHRIQGGVSLSLWQDGAFRGLLALNRPVIGEKLLDGRRVFKKGDLLTVDPPLRVRVRYRNLTPHGLFRHARFVGFEP